MTKRPPPTLRIAIVIAAVACLGLAMCARSKPQTTPQAAPPPAQANPPTQQAPDDNSNAPPPIETGKGKKGEDHFPATKAPGRLY
jgi:hypothetical protein